MVLSVRTTQILKSVSQLNRPGFVKVQCQLPLVPCIQSSLSFRHCSTNKGLKSPNVQELLDNAATFQSEEESDNAWSTSPYPKGVVNPRDQSRHALRPRVDPRETSLILFPGEGSQYVGMGRNLLKFPGVADIFEAANDILKYDLLSLCLRGPKDELDKTKHAQVAVMVLSFAALERLKEERPSCVDSCIATAGFGIGELTALTFAGAISFERAVRLAQLRGETMQVASEMAPSGMITVLYKASTRLHQVLTTAKEYASVEGVKQPLCEVAHYLFPHCKVIAGHSKCLDFIEKNYKQLDLIRVRRLNVCGAPHTKLMQPAADTFRKYLDKSNFKEPVIAVHSTVDGKPYNGADTIAKKLTAQIVKPVRWEQLMHVLYERPAGHHFPNTFEVGPGESLRMLLKMTNAKAYDNCINVFDKPGLLQ